jgi:uncharacterized protein YcfL
MRKKILLLLILFFLLSCSATIQNHTSFSSSFFRALLYADCEKVANIVKEQPVSVLERLKKPKIHQINNKIFLQFQFPNKSIFVEAEKEKIINAICIDLLEV